MVLGYLGWMPFSERHMMPPNELKVKKMKKKKY